jgi:hypothetical protein
MISYLSNQGNRCMISMTALATVSSLNKAVLNQLEVVLLQHSLLLCHP